MIDFENLKTIYDNGNMFDAIHDFPKQIEVSLKNMTDWYPKYKYKEIKNILITGMGGSAIGGDFISSLINKNCMVPIIINRSYEIPGWVNKNTLVICSSYSGNTEETLTALQKASKMNAQIIAVTTGGKLGKIAEKEKYDVVLIEQGLQPRAALGFSISLNLLLLEKIELAQSGIFKNLLSYSIIKLNEELKVYSNFNNRNIAIKYAKLIHDKFPIIYSGEGWQGNCALRLRGQLAENAKMLSSNLYFPEQNHNEIEGWTCNLNLLKNTIIVWIIDENDHDQVKKRMKITKQLLDNYPSNQIVLKVNGKSSIERSLCMIQLIDWISYFCALLNKVDPTPVQRITELKNRLSKD